MKKPILSIFIFLLLAACQQKNTEETKTIEVNRKKISFKDFFYYADSLSRNKTKQVKLDSFKTYKELVERIDELACQDSLPYISWQEENIRKNVFIHNVCPNDHTCYLIRRNRIILIKNDTIYDEKLSLNYKNLIDIINKRIKDQGKTEDEEVYLGFWIMYEDELPAIKILPDMQMLIQVVEQYKPSVHFGLQLNKPHKIIPSPPPPDMIIDLPLDDER